MVQAFVFDLTDEERHAIDAVLSSGETGSKLTVAKRRILQRISSSLTERIGNLKKRGKSDLERSQNMKELRTQRLLEKALNLDVGEGQDATPAPSLRGGGGGFSSNQDADEHADPRHIRKAEHSAGDAGDKESIRSPADERAEGADAYFEIALREMETIMKAMAKLGPSKLSPHNVEKKKHA